MQHNTVINQLASHDTLTKTKARDSKNQKGEPIDFISRNHMLATRTKSQLDIEKQIKIDQHKKRIRESKMRKLDADVH